MDVSEVYEQMRHRCDIQDTEYWDVKLEEEEEMVPSEECSFDSWSFCVRDKAGFVTTVLFQKNDCFFRARITVPSTFGPPDFQEMPATVGSPYWTARSQPTEQLFVGWDHHGQGDARLSMPLATQPGKRVSGPVQVLDEARYVIRAMMVKK